MTCVEGSETSLPPETLDTCLSKKENESTYGMHICYASEIQEWEKKHATILGKILHHLKTPKSKELFHKSQGAWRKAQEVDNAFINALYSTEGTIRSLHTDIGHLEDIKSRTHFLTTLYENLNPEGPK